MLSPWWKFDYFYLLAISKIYNLVISFFLWIDCFRDSQMVSALLLSSGLVVVCCYPVSQCSSSCLLPLCWTPFTLRMQRAYTFHNATRFSFCLTYSLSRLCFFMEPALSHRPLGPQLLTMMKARTKPKPKKLLMKEQLASFVHHWPCWIVSSSTMS